MAGEFLSIAATLALAGVKFVVGLTLLLFVIGVVLSILEALRPEGSSLSHYVFVLVGWGIGIAVLCVIVYILGIGPARIQPEFSAWLYTARDIHRQPGRPVVEFGFRRVDQRGTLSVDLGEYKTLGMGDPSLSTLKPWGLPQNGRYRAWSSLREIAQQHQSAHVVVVFVHGYANDTADAQFSTKLLAEAWPWPLTLNSAFISYVWQSSGRIAKYSQDEQAAADTTDSLQWFIESLMLANPNRTIILVAHSMGARVAMEVLKRGLMRPRFRPHLIEFLAPGQRSLLPDTSPLSPPRRPPIFATVLIAPDIRADDFVSDMTIRRETILGSSKHLLLFGSPNDAVLRMSAVRDGNHPRAGQGPEEVRDIRSVLYVDCGDCGRKNFGHSYQDGAVRRLYEAFQSLPDPTAESGR